MRNSPDTLSKRNAKRKYWRETIDPTSFPHTKLKKCVNCKFDKYCEWMSSFTQTGIPEYRSRCKECYLVYARAKNKKNRKRVTQNALDRKYKRKQKCINYLGGKCVFCGYCKSAKALTFHHINPSDKSTDVSKILDYGWETLKSELDKCQLLCFNCHMEEEERLYNESKRKC